MTVTVQDEAPRPAAGPAFSDAVTFAFGDPAADVFGIARVGLSPGPDGAPQGSGLGILFSGREPIAVRAAGGITPSGDGWDGVEAAGVRTSVVEPLRRWTVAFVSEDGTAGVDLEVTALTGAVELDPEDPVAAAGGMTGYEQLCRVRGTARVRGGDRRIDCLGQRGHSWGEPDWDGIALARTIGAWVAEDRALTLSAVRPATRKATHADELVAATLVVPGDDGEGPLAISVHDPRLSTTSDAEDRQRRAGLELWLDEDGYPVRGSGEVLCGTSLDLGRLRLDCAFFRWTLDGRTGVGRYDVLRRVG